MEKENINSKYIALGLLGVIVILVLFAFTLVAIEVKTLKPIMGNDCRIVNTVEAIKQNKELRIYAKDGVVTRHIIALNEDGTIIDKSYVDLSKNEKNEDNNLVSEFEKTKGVKQVYSFKNGVGTVYENSAETYTDIFYIRTFIFLYAFLY